MRGWFRGFRGFRGFRRWLAKIASKRSGRLNRPRSRQSEATSGQPPRMNSRRRTKASVGPEGRTERSSKSLGDRGERLAARWLSRRGYRILHRNYTLGRDEADLIALDPDGETIVIVEVKTRSHPQASPEWSLGRDKGYRLARLAARLDGVPEFRDRPVRIDAVAIVWPESKEPQVRHYEAAFESPY